MRNAMSVLVMVGLVMILATGAQAVLFQDDFENNTTVSMVAYPDTSGDFDPDNPAAGTWVSQETSDTMIQVSSFVGGSQPPAAHSGNNYLISGYHYQIDGSWTTYGLPAAEFTPTTHAIIDFWFYGTDGTMDNYITSYDSAFDEGVALIRPTTGGGILYFSGGAYQSATSTWTAGIWNNMVLDIDIAGGTVTMTMNDQPTETIGFYGAGADVGYVRFYSDYSGYYDDIVITPEPVTMTLLLVGGLALRRRR